MPTVIEISDPEDPRLAPYRDLKDAPGRPAAEGRFIVEGEIVLRQLAASPFAVESVLATPGKLESLGDLLESLPDEAVVYRATKPVIDSIVGFAFHRGTIAVGRRGTPRDLASLADRASTLIVLEEVSNVDNLGAIFRSVSALAPAGAGVVLSPGCADPLYRKALRASMGHVLNIPFTSISGDAWPNAIFSLADRGYHLVALTPAEGSIDVAAYSPPPDRKLALLIGAEGPGLTARVLEGSGSRVRIAMRPGVDSLNLVVATSIALHRLFG